MRLEKEGEEGILLPHAHAHFSLMIRVPKVTKMDIFAMGEAPKRRTQTKVAAQRRFFFTLTPDFSGQPSLREVTCRCDTLCAGMIFTSATPFAVEDTYMYEKETLIMEESGRLEKEGEEGILLPRAHAHFSSMIRVTKVTKMDVFAMGAAPKRRTSNQSSRAAPIFFLHLPQIFQCNPFCGGRYRCNTFCGGRDLQA